MNAIVVAGIDLAGAARRPTGVCLLRGLNASTAVLFEDRDILSFIRDADPELIAVDAPLHLPPGRRSIEDRNGEHFRRCDLELRKLGIPFFPITLGPMRSLTARGIALKSILEKEGRRVVEMYPGGALDVWKIPRAHRDLKKLRTGLARLGIRGLPKDASSHELDAAAGAMVGRLYLQGKARVLGDFRTGAILLPRPPSPRRFR
jgi:predicted nuclease with RNAse H fold